LSPEFQADMPLQMFVFPIIPDVVLPEAFVKYAQIPQKPAMIDPVEISHNRETWIQTWMDTVLR